MFDIVVPTYNRYEALAEFFDNIAPIDKSLYTLWLIDDYSTKKDISVVPAWNNIRFIQLPKNIGQAGARNYAIDKGIAPYVISLDDDAWFTAETQNLNKIAEGFKKYTDAGCLMFNIATPNTPFTANIDGLLLPLHVTCGCAYRRSSLEEINGFSTFLHSSAEETDISLKLYKAGWVIRSLYSVHVFHNFDPGKRSTDWYIRVRYNETRNCLITAYIHYPSMALIWALPGKAINQLLFALKARIATGKTFVAEVKAIVEFIRMIPQLKQYRNPLSYKQFKKWRSL